MWTAYTGVIHCVRYLTRFRTYKIAVSPKTKTKRGGGLSWSIFKKSRHLGFGIFIDIWSMQPPLLPEIDFFLKEQERQQIFSNFLSSCYRILQYLYLLQFQDYGRNLVIEKDKFFFNFMKNDELFGFFKSIFCHKNMGKQDYQLWTNLCRASGPWRCQIP